jgi:hypothetical protein
MHAGISVINRLRLNVEQPSHLERANSCRRGSEIVQNWRDHSRRHTFFKERSIRSVMRDPQKNLFAVVVSEVPTHTLCQSVSFAMRKFQPSSV